MTRRKVAFSTFATLFGVVSAQNKQVFNYQDTKFTLQSCVRANTKDVQCSFSVVNNSQDDSFLFAKDTYLLISPKGNEVNINTIEFNSKPLSFYTSVTVRKGITYIMKFTFSDYGDSVIKYFDYGQQRFENVPVLASASAVPTTSALPGTPEMRQRIKIGDTNYVAVLHGCFAVGTGASCLVSALPENVKGSVSKPLTVYPATLLQYDDQVVIGGVVNLQVGDSLFKSVPVR
jgi:hypothetical protein